eukprot:TRINITY_DN10747_c1_g1_i3.p2 TRINITY_DN10747_c1_g1~~TRINITY_DN10747_c1_g1_i3.p2  ORF type:complete len:212 (+),score=25.77 TRINITY_DN10747_c1_g1_i3:309-944(+)
MPVEQSEISVVDEERGSILSPTNGSHQQQQRPKRDCFLVFCSIVNVITGLCGLLCLVAYCMALSEGAPLTQPDSVKPQVLRLYGVFFSLFIILTETEWQWFTSWVRVVDVWFVRGLLYIFFAVLTLQLATPQPSEEPSDFKKSLQLYRSVSGFALFSCGGFYVLGGVLCFQILKRKRHQRERERDRVLKDLEELDRQREELLRLRQVYSAD